MGSADSLVSNSLILGVGKIDSKYLDRKLDDISVSLNLKDIGVYSNVNEVSCGQTFFPTDKDTQEERSVWRKVVVFGALGNSASVNVAHGISVSSDYVFTRIYGVATDKTANKYLPIPFFAKSSLNNGIELSVDATKVYIDVGIDRTSYSAYVILEYVKF